MRTVPLRLWPLFAVFLFALPQATLAQKDSTAIYRKIHDYSQKRKVTRWIYEAIFAQPETDQEPPAPQTPQRRVNPVERYTGRVVRNVNITVTDPFGFSVDDTTKAPVAWVQRTGNKLHRRTRHYVVRDLLLVHPNDTLDPARIAESERLLRASPVVAEARIIVSPVKGARDSVDVLVVVHDRWNFDVFGSADLTSVNATFRDRNVLGFGHEIEQNIVYGPGFKQPELSGKYTIYNIEGTYITSVMQYSTTEIADNVGLSFDRPFFSPLTRWAGSVSVGKAWSRIPVLDPDGTQIGTVRLDPISFDSWLGRSFPFANDGTLAGRQSSIVGGLRHSRLSYALRPSFDEDTLRVNVDRTLWLASGGFSARQYYKERYLFRFGITEDVPEGLLIKATSGFRTIEGERDQVYTGIEVSHGRYRQHFGYLSLYAGYGTFWRDEAGTDATFRLGALWFSDLVTMGRWHLRQFVRGTAVMGFGKPAYSRLNINGDQLYGYDSPIITGAHKEILRLETVVYAPYNILGFRFAPVFAWGMATIGEETDPVLSGRINHAFTLGILVRNENLLVNTFEVSFGFFPYVPGDGHALFKTGAFTDFSLRAPDFMFTRPDVVAFD